MQSCQVHFQPMLGRANTMELQQTFFYPRLQIDSDGTHVPGQLGLRFLERKIQATLLSLAGGFDKMRRDTGFTAACRSRHKNRAATVIAFTLQQLVEIGNSAGNSLAGRAMVQTKGRNGKHRDSMLIDEEGLLVGAVHTSAIFDYPQASSGKLAGDSMIQHDDTIGDVFFQAIAG